MYKARKQRKEHGQLYTRLLRSSKGKIIAGLAVGSFQAATKSNNVFDIFRSTDYAQVEVVSRSVTN